MTEPTPAELAERYADSEKSSTDEPPAIAYRGFLAGLAEGKRRRQKRDAEIARDLFAIGAWEGRGACMAIAEQIAAAILAEGGGE